MQHIDERGKLACSPLRAGKEVMRMRRNWNAGGENQSPSYPPLLKGEARGIRGGSGWIHCVKVVEEC